MSIYTRGAMTPTQYNMAQSMRPENQFGAADTAGSSSIFAHLKKHPIPQTYAVASWTLQKSREDAVPLPDLSLKRFMLGRSAPWPVDVNSRSQCVLHYPHNQFYCYGCGPDQYNPHAYAVNTEKPIVR